MNKYYYLSWFDVNQAYQSVLAWVIIIFCILIPAEERRKQVLAYWNCYVDQDKFMIVNYLLLLYL